MDKFVNSIKVPLPDLAYLRMMADGDIDFIKSFVETFFEDGPKMLKMLKESAESGDHERLKTISHKLITQLSSVGILSVITDVKRINQGSRDMTDLKATVDRIIEITNISIEHLKKMI